MKPLAIMPVYNEADIIPWTIKHLIDEGCEVYVLDNWSTDGSGDIARSLGCEVERWPDAAPVEYDWTGILKRIEEIAMAHPGRWVMLNDADEIRRSFAFSLAEALAVTGAAGFNSAGFYPITFHPIDNGYTGDPENYFRFYSLDHVDNQQMHLKAWVQLAHRVDIHSTGGHEVRFPGRLVSPRRFVLKHYPIRSQEHGERKVLEERYPRYPQAERAKGWHVQYDKCGRIFLRDPQELTKWE